ncbi:MAG: polysaccharide biosynthesis tyrosine autokinase [Bacteroidota bacterium]
MEPNISEKKDFNGDIDFDKLLAVVKKSTIWVILIFITITTVGYLFFIRWQKPLYEAVSDLKLDIKTEASLLGIENPTPYLQSIAAEIELITSRFFLNKLIETINYDVSYYYYGKVLVEERYKNSPFKVNYDLESQYWLNKKIDIDILDSETISIDHGSKAARYNFGEFFKMDGITLSINKADNFSQEAVGSYYFTINSEDALLQYFLQNFSAAPLNISGKSITLSLKDHNKIKAAEFLTAIDTTYLRYTKEEKNKATNLQIKFLNEQLRQTENKLEEYENYFEDFTIENKTTDLQAEMGSSLAKLEELEKEKFSLRSSLVTVQILLEELEKKDFVLAIPSSEDFEVPEIGKAITELNNSVQKKRILLNSYNENTFVIEKQDEEIKIQKSQIKELLNQTKAALTKNISVMEKKENELESSFKDLPSLGTEYTKNKRNYELYEGFYLSQLERKNEFEIAQAGTVTDFAILSPPRVSGTPISPKPLYVYGAALVVSFVFSFLFIALRYLLHNKIGSLKELEALIQAPVLGMIPHYSAEKMPETKLLVDRRPKSVLSESLRSIRTNMEFINAKKDHKTISVTSTVSGEGKTFVSVNLGAIIAMSNLKVIILDLDMRKPKVHKAFGHDFKNKGISTILINKHGIEESIGKTSIENLDYIQAGPTPPNPSELLLSDEFNLLLNKLKAEYDLVIMDTPPVGLVTDAVILMKKVDLPIYILRANYSKRNFTELIKRLINVNGISNISLILNALAESKHQTYGYGSSYYKYYEDEAYSKKGKFKFLTNFFNF